MTNYVEDAINSGLLPFVTSEKGDFLSMVNQISLRSSVLSFQSLLSCDKLAERRGDEFQDDS